VSTKVDSIEDLFSKEQKDQIEDEKKKAGIKDKKKTALAAKPKEVK
jgi:hypothetical protein